MSKFLASILIILFIQNSYSQGIRDTAIFIPMAAGSFNFQMPGGDLADRFGNNLSICPAFQIKTRKNFFYGVESQIMFGNNIKEDNIFSALTTSDNSIINMYGEFSRIAISQRGLFIQGRFGKMVYNLGPNPNCGFYLMGGVGLFQHKFRIDVDGNNVPQLDEEYKKGYDKLTNGLGISESIGYLFLHNKGTINFYIELEFIQAWTQSRREIDFNLMQKDDTQRNDYLFGLKLGWILPFYTKTPDKYYYY